MSEKKKRICRLCGREYEIDEVSDALDLYCLECRYTYKALIRYSNERYARL
jgi:hypothetical protein